MDIHSNSIKETINWTATALARAQQLFNEDDQAQAHARVCVLEAFLMDALRSTRSMRVGMEKVGRQQAEDVGKLEAEFAVFLEGLPLYEGEVPGEAA